MGKSDHLGVLVTKKSKEVRTFARTTRKRIYKNFNKEAFLHDIEKAKREGKFDAVHSADNPMMLLMCLRKSTVIFLIAMLLSKSSRIVQTMCLISHLN